MKRFTITENGYSRQEVNQFIDDVIKNTEDIIKRVKLQQQEIASLKKELEFYRKGNVHDQEQQILQKAKEDASKILDDAVKRYAKIEEKIERLEQRMQQFNLKLEESTRQKNDLHSSIEDV